MRYLVTDCLISAQLRLWPDTTFFLSLIRGASRVESEMCHLSRVAPEREESLKWTLNDAVYRLTCGWYILNTFRYMDISFSWLYLYPLKAFKYRG